MGTLIPFYRKNFIDSLGESNKEKMNAVEIGHELKVDCHCGSVLNGRLDSFDEDGIVLIINKKSRAIIKGESIKVLKKIEE